MTIRPYNPVDNYQLLALLQLNTPAYFSPEEREDFITYLQQEIDHYYVVEEENKIWACGGFNRTEDGLTAKISWDIVHPEKQGKGVGSLLTRFRIRKIKEIPGIRSISVRTSQLVYPFYEKFGFELKEVVQDYWAKGFDLYRMEREINLENETL